MTVRIARQLREAGAPPPPTVAVVIPTFNRPKMLRAALASAVGADELIVVDDGCDYDVAAWCAPYPVTRIVSAPPMTVNERMTTPRQGRLINEALRGVQSTISTLLCDDDLLAPGWLATLRAHWTAWPDAAIVRGTWLMFQDGDTPTLADPPSPMCQARKMTAGNFAWASRLTTRGTASWPEAQLNCLDDGFLRSLQAAGINVFGVPNIGFAGWRRNHPKVNTNYSSGSRHTEAFRAVLAGGHLE